MKKILVAFTFALGVTVSFAQRSNDDFSGRWQAEDKAVVTIKKEGCCFVGHDEKGNKVLYDIRFEDGEWIGRGRDPFTGLSGSCEVSFDGNRLKVRGGLGFIKTSHYFTKL